METCSPVRGSMLEHAFTVGLVIEHQVQECVASPGLRSCDASLAQDTGTHNLDNCVLFGKSCGGFQWLQGLLGFQCHL